MPHFVSERKTCNGKFILGTTGSMMDYDACKRYCDDDMECKFFFHIPSLEETDDQFNCVKYFSCEENRITSYSGTTYSRQISRPGIYFMCILGR